jgi:hypothetical protein
MNLNQLLQKSRKNTELYCTNDTRLSGYKLVLARAVWLALVYFGCVIALQFLLRGVTGGSTLAIVASTLAIAFLFHPLRRRTQHSIDRRFYRSKYDTVRTLEDFSAAMREEVDLTQLTEQLIAVVQKTMQPVSVSLWLRQPANHQNKRATRVLQ